MRYEPTDKFSPAALGEEEAPGRLLPLAWRMVADPEGVHPPPPEPSPEDDFMEGTVEWWIPLVHLVTYGLGWAQPGLGLQRWVASGRPTDHPILQVVDTWWGEAVADFVAWSSGDSAAATITWAVLDAAPHHRFTEKELSPVRTARWFHPSLGGDPLHLSDHVLGPVKHSRVDARRVITSSRNRTVGVLLADTAVGWYRELLATATDVPWDAPSPTVDVIVQPLGWLGTYRRSHQSGLWFTGQHRWHQLGLSR